MLNLTRISVQRTCPVLCQRIFTRSALSSRAGDFMRQSPLCGYGNSLLSKQGKTNLVHGRTARLLINPLNWLYKQTLSHQRCVPWKDVRCTFTGIQTNSYHTQVKTVRKLSGHAHRKPNKEKNNGRLQQKSKNNDKNGEKPEEQLTLVQRFKKTYREHGKILVAVHLVTSSVWFGSFFLIAQSGMDVVGLLEWMGFSERITKPFKSSNLGNVAVAYLMYKLATPARYTVTLGGTNMAIKYLRKGGKLPPLRPENKLSSLGKEATTKTRMRTRKRMKSTRSKIQLVYQQQTSRYRRTFQRLRQKYNKNRKNS